MQLKPKSLFIFSFLMAFSVESFSATETLNDYPRDQLRKFTEVYSVIKNNYVEDIDDNKLFNDAIAGALAGLDPHSTYLDYEGLKDFGIATGGEFGGLGLEVGMEDGLVKVVSPIEDTPAYRAGIKSGDLIVQLDGVSVKGLSISDAIKKMRGKPDTQIKLSISRKGESGLVDILLTRAIIKKGGQVGKRLDFMMQELNREANTVGSKAAVKELSDAAMQMKLLIEQMREQVQNLE
jgi:carboxyl-terminal processing protease